MKMTKNYAVDYANSERAESAQHGLDAFAEASGMSADDEDAQEIMSDLIGNLGHLADRLGLDFHAIVKRALICHAVEKLPNDGWNAPPYEATIAVGPKS
jgi:hypothetical protein